MKSSVIVVGTLAIVLVFFVGSVVVLQQLGKIQDESTFSAPILSTSDDSSDFAVTLVTQSSPERLWLLRETCLRWRGPIVLVAFVRSEDTADSESHLYIPLQNGTKGKIGSTVCPNVEVVTYHPALDGNDPSTSRYPVNKLRNIGIAAVRTSHFLYLDIDFWPSSTIEQHLAQFHKHEPYRKIFEADKSAVVVPAFNFLAISNGCLYADTCRQTYQRNAPRTFHQLRQCLDERRCQIFDVYRNPGGHSSTNTPHWLQMPLPGNPADATSVRGAAHFDSSEPYVIPCFESIKYEPYIVLKRSSSMPRFDERFSGYGKNKIEFIQNLRLLNFSFVVLPQLFAVHLPHAKSTSFETWLESDRQYIDTLFDEFMSELASQNEGHYDTHMCEAAIMH